MTHAPTEQPPSSGQPVNPDELGPAQPHEVDQPGGAPLAPDERGKDHRPEDHHPHPSKGPSSR